MNNSFYVRTDYFRDKNSAYDGHEGLAGRMRLGEELRRRLAKVADLVLHALTHDRVLAEKRFICWLIDV